MANVLSLSAKISAEKLVQAMQKMRFADFGILHATIGEDVLNLIRARFDSGQDPDGKKWPKIKRYFNRNAKRWREPTDPPLKLLDLYQSFSYDATEEMVVIGTPKPYAQYHTDAPKNNGNPRKYIPLREFMGLSNENVEGILDTIEDFIDKILPPSDVAGAV